ARDDREAVELCRPVETWGGLKETTWLPAGRILPGRWKSLAGAACSAGESEERSPATSHAPGLTGGRGFGQNPLHPWHKVRKGLSLQCRSGRTKTAQQIGQSTPMWLPRGRAPGGGSAGNHQ